MRNSLTGTAKLEAELSSARRQLTALRNDYLELGLATSMLAGARDRTLTALRLTQRYIESAHPDCKIADGSRRQSRHARRPFTHNPTLQPPRENEQWSRKNIPNGNAFTAGANRRAGQRVLETLGGYFISESRSPGAELASVHSQLAHLAADYLELSERAEEIGSQRDSALIELREAQLRAEKLMPISCVRNRQAQRSASPSDAFSSRLAAIEARLDQTRLEKNDIAIMLAESNGRVAELQCRLHAQLDDLARSLSDLSDKDKDKGNDPASTGAAVAGERRNIRNLVRIATQLVFLIGIPASLAAVWDISSGGARYATVHEGFAAIETQPSDAEDRLPLPNTAELAPMNSQRASAADSSAREYGVTTGDPESERGEQEQMALSVQQENTALLVRTMRQARGERNETFPPARAYLREPGDALDRWYDNCVKGGGDAEECAFLEKNLFKESVIRLPNGVQYSVIRNGTGASPGPTDTVFVNFRGMLLDGSEFYSSRSQGGAIHFRLDEAIPGLQEVLQYMEEGAQWEVYIPSELAFRKPAPFGGQTVVFYLELVAIAEAPRPDSEAGVAQARVRRALAAAHADPEEQFADAGGINRNELASFSDTLGPPPGEESPAADHSENTGDRMTREARAAREHVMSQPGLLLQMVGAQALTEDGRFAGYRVTGTVDNDFLGRLDLAPGDLIVAVNGVPIDTPDHGLKALTSLSGTGPLSFTAIRDGRVKVLSHFSPP